MDATEVLTNEVLALRSAVFGRDGRYSDELAELLHLDEDEQRAGETDESYKARVLRVKERKERLNVSPEG